MIFDRSPQRRGERGGPRRRLRESLRSLRLCVSFFALAIATGCASPPPPKPEPKVTAKPAPPPPTPKPEAPIVPTIEGSGLARPSAPPQRRYRLVTVLGGGLVPFRLRVIEEENAADLPPAGEPTKIPDQERVAAPPPEADPKGPPLLPVPAPR